jgi:hypothetical protein
MSLKSKVLGKLIVFIGLFLVAYTIPFNFAYAGKFYAHELYNQCVAECAATCVALYPLEQGTTPYYCPDETEPEYDYLDCDDNCDLVNCVKIDEGRYQCATGDWVYYEGRTCTFNLFKMEAYTECLYMDIRQYVVSSIDIRRTVMDMTTTLSTDVPMYIATGKGIDQAAACMTMAGEGIVGKPSDELLDIIATLDPEDCATFIANPLAVAAGVEDPANLYAYSTSSGSLAGLALRGAGIVYNQPIPVNLAYYARDVASRVPFLKNTAFAQKIETGGFPGFDLILSIWKITRNAALGAVAVFMVVTGIMIMMRKKLDPKTAVTVQNALPRLVISLTLIVFSYTIGALMVGLLGPLTSVSLEPIRQASKDWQTYGPLVTFFVLMWGAGGGMAATIFTMILYTTAGIVMILVFAWAIFKLLLAYVEILILVIIAPLQFAWGSIPGNEDAIISWFKAIAANILAVPAVTAGLSLGLYFAWSSLTDEALRAQSAGVAGPAASEWFSAGVSGWENVLVPIMVIGIFIMASKFPNKLKEAIMEKR